MEQLNPVEAKIMGIIEGHRGKENAISRKDLVDRVNEHWPLAPINERKIRERIKHMTTQHGFAIGSCRLGYFVVETAEELEEICKYYDSYGLSSLFVAAKLRKKHLAEYLGQLSIGIGKQDK